MTKIWYEVEVSEELYRHYRVLAASENEALILAEEGDEHDNVFLVSDDTAGPVAGGCEVIPDANLNDEEWEMREMANDEVGAVPEEVARDKVAS